MAFGAPENPTISNVNSQTKLRFNFDDSVDESGQPYQRYLVRYGTSSNLTGNGEICASAKNANSYTGNFPSGNLNAGTTYYAEFAFEDTNIGEISAWVPAASSATTDTAAPAAPTLNAATSVTFETIGLSWNAVQGATEYRLFMDEGSGDPTSGMQEFDQQTWQSPPQTSYTFGNEQGEDMDEAQTYSFRLKAYNSAGTSGYSNKLTQSTIFEDEGEITLSNNLTTSNTIQWTATESDAGGDEGRLYGEINDTTPDVQINVGDSSETGTGTKSYIHSGLTEGGVYSYQLRIYTNYNNNFYTAGPVSTVTNPAGAPGNIATFTTTADDENSISLSWSASANATSYDLDYSTNNSTWVVILNNQNQTTYNHTGLNHNTRYYYRVRGVGNGNGNYKNQNTYTTPLPPSTFSYVGLHSTGDQDVRFTVTEPTGATRIYIYANDGTQLTKSGNDWLAVDGSGTTTFDASDWEYAGEFINDALETNAAIPQPLKFKSYSDNSGQQSSFSSTIQGYTLPGTPVSFSADADTYDKITMTWGNPSGASLSETFYLEWGTDTNYGTTYTTAANATSHQVTGLNGSTTYYFRGTTITAAGNSNTLSTTSEATLSGPNPTNEGLEMKYLGVMTGDAAVGSAGMDQPHISMSGSNDNQTTEISFKDFFAGALSSISGPSTLAPSATATYTAVFSNSGDAFNAQVTAGKFSWTHTGYATEGSNVGRTCAYTAAGPPQTGFTITCTFTPSFNDHMSTVVAQKTVTIGTG